MMWDFVSSKLNRKINPKTKHGRLYWLVGVLFIFSSHSFAGQTCEDADSSPQKIMTGFELAHQLNSYLNQSQANIVLLARVGQDLSKYNLRYSHLGIAQKNAQGHWIVMHELNQCGTAQSALFNEGLANFFMDDPFKYEALVLIPSIQTQEKIRTQLKSPTAKNLHYAHYNMMAFPFSTQFQNSNQWVLEMIAAALSSDIAIENRQQAQAWLQLKQYQPDTIHLSATTRLGARLFKANISFSDHPFGRRMAGQIDTVTVESVVRFLQKNEPQLTQKVVSQPE